MNNKKARVTTLTNRAASKSRLVSPCSLATRNRSWAACSPLGCVWRGNSLKTLGLTEGESGVAKTSRASRLSTMVKSFSLQRHRY